MVDFEAVYRAHFQDVYRFVLRLSGDAHVAEEITSQTFLQAMEAIGSFRGECRLSVWLCQIAKHIYFAHRRRAGRMVSLDACAPEKAADGLEEQVLRRDQAARIRTILCELPELQRDVFSWRVFASLSFREIGRLYGRTDNWACVTFHRTRALIQKRLEENADEV